MDILSSNWSCVNEYIDSIFHIVRMDTLNVVNAQTNKDLHHILSAMFSSQFLQYRIFTDTNTTIWFTPFFDYSIIISSLTHIFQWFTQYLDFWMTHPQWMIYTLYISQNVTPSMDDLHIIITDARSYCIDTFIYIISWNIEWFTHFLRCKLVLHRHIKMYFKHQNDLHIFGCKFILHIQIQMYFYIEELSYQTTDILLIFQTCNHRQRAQHNIINTVGI